MAGPSDLLIFSPNSDSTFTNPIESTKEARLPDQKLINAALTDVVLSILFRSADKFDWIACSMVCRSWRNCLNNPKHIANFFDKAIASEYICSNLANENSLWTTLIKASRTNVQIYLDASNSMDHTNAKLKSVIPALSTIRKIAQNCFLYVGKIDLHTFSDKVEGSHTYTNFADLDGTLNAMKFRHNITDFNFLISVLIGPKQDDQTSQTDFLQRKIFFLSDMRDVPREKASILMGKLSKTSLNNVEVEFINVSTEENPPFMTGLAKLEEENELPPYVTYRNYETVAAPVLQKRRRDLGDEDSDPKKARTEP